jgi:hypothetical protein
MNRKQKISLWAGIIVFVAMGLFPPWYHTQDTWSDYRYSFLWHPPMSRYYERAILQRLYFDPETGRPNQSFRPDLCYQLDLHRLYVQWAMVVVATGGLMLTFHGRKEMNPPRPESRLFD